MWNAPHWSAASRSRASASWQSTRNASSAPYWRALSGSAAMSGSSGWPRSALNAYGTAPASRIHATAQQVSRPPEKAKPMRSPRGSELRMTRFTLGLNLQVVAELLEQLVASDRASDDEDRVVAGDRACDVRVRRLVELVG